MNVNDFIRENYLRQTDEELGKIVNLSAHQVRRRRKKMGLDKAGVEKEEVEDAIIESRKDQTIQRLRDELEHVKKLYKSKTRESAAMDALVEAIYASAPTMKAVRAPKPVVKVNGREQESVVLCLGDIHYGELVDEEQTGGISVYNMDVAKRRLAYTVDTAISIMIDKLRGYQFTKLYVFGLGDMVSGIIHDELLINDEVGIVEQVLDITECLAEQLTKLCQVFDAVHFTGVVGNHGRVSQEKYFKSKAVNNYDYMVYKLLEKLLANQGNLTFNNPKAFWASESVEGTRFLLMHGDIVKSWNQIPFYGLSRAYMKWRALKQDFGVDFDHLVVGHFHTPNIMSMMRYKLIVNGCLKGGDEYSIGAVSAASDPVQMMFGVHPRKGITWHFDINSKDIR